MDKKQLSERDICTKFITPALRRAGWDEQTQLREEVTFTKGRVIVRGRIAKRGKAKRADYVLYYKPNIPLAVIEAKDNHASVGDGIQQASSTLRRCACHSCSRRTAMDSCSGTARDRGTHRHHRSVHETSRHRRCACIRCGHR